MHSKFKALQAAPEVASVKGTKSADEIALIDEEYRENDRDNTYRGKVDAELAKVIEHGFTEQSLLNGWIDVENVGEFDTAEPVVKVKGLRVYSTSRGGYIDESTLTEETQGVPRDTMGFHIVEFNDKLRAGFAAKFEVLKAKGLQKFEVEANRRIISGLRAATSTSDTGYVSVAGLTKAVLDEAITDVEDAAEVEGDGEVNLAVLSRGTLLDVVASFNFGFNPVVSEEVRQKGYLGTYKGAAVIRVKNTVDDDGVSYMPRNEMFVVGRKVGRWVNYGGTQVNSWVENTRDYTHFRARKDVGFVVSDPGLCRRIVDSTVAA